jgi:hypothetical protein
MIRPTSTKNKTIILILILVALGIGLYLLLDKRSETPEDKIEEEQNILDTTLAKMKEAIKMDLNLMPLRITWNTESNEERILDGKGYYYADVLGAQKIQDIFISLDDLLKKTGFKDNEQNRPINSEGNILRKYKKSEIVCNLAVVDNSNGTSSLSAACANINSLMFDFASGLGNECVKESDCGVLTDGCKKATVCRNISYKFYNTCDNPSSLVKDIDFSVAACECLKNQCTPKKQSE